MALHKDLSGEQLHTPGYIQDSDPGAVGTGKLWVDTSDPADPRWKIRNAADDDWDDWTSASAAALNLDDLDDVDATSPSDGEALVFDSGSGLWVPGAVSGGSGSDPYPDSAPGSPSAYDDEFTAGTLDAKWTVDVNPTATGAVVTSGKFSTWQEFFSSPGAASNNTYRIKQALSGFASGTALTVTAKVSLTVQNGSYANVGFSVGDSSTFESGNYVDLLLIGNGQQHQVQKWDGSSSVLTLGLGIHRVYLHFQRDTSNLVRLFYSVDGTGWNILNSTTRAWDANYLFAQFNGGGSTSQPHISRMDWIRVNDSRFLLP